MPRRKLRIAKWEEEYHPPWYKRLFRRRFRPGSLEEEYKALEQKQKEALARGDKKRAREYGRKKMRLRLEAWEKADRMVEEAEVLRGRFFDEIMRESEGDEELKRLAMEMMRADAEYQRTGSKEADQRFDELLNEWISRHQEKVRQKEAGRG